VRWEHLSDVGEDGKSATFPHLKGLRNGDIATSRIKQARALLPTIIHAALALMPLVQADIACEPEHCGL
jgi:hypothetical protein